MGRQLIEIVYQDDDLVVVNKAAGLLVHRTSISSDRVFLLQKLRDQLGKRVYPIHRLDRPTSGLLMLAVNQPFATSMQRLFEAGAIHKTYWAVVRGYVQEGQIDKAIEDGRATSARPALTQYRMLRQFELPFAMEPHATSRYTLAEVNPKTGRRHQIRQHFVHIRHPIIGDTVYGDGKHNRMFREKFACSRLLLAAVGLEFNDPRDQRLRTFTQQPDKCFLDVLAQMQTYADSSSSTT